MSLLKPRNLLLLLALLLAGALAAVVATRYRPAGEVAEVVKSLPAGVDVALQDINYTHSEGGVPRWRLVARQVEHRSAQQLTAVEEPQLTFYDAGGAEQGTLRARRGQLAADYSTIEVSGAVEIVSAGGYTVKTEVLTFRQADRSIRTMAPVTLVSDRLRLDGVGMNLDLGARQLQILNKVHAVVGPQPLKREKS